MVGKRWVSRVRAVEPEHLAVCCDQPSGSGACRCQADLLAEHGLHGDLRSVDLARHPQARHGCDQRREHRVLRERRIDRHRVAVGIEKPARSLGGRGQVAGVRQA